MPTTQYIQLTIGGRLFDVPTSDDLPVTIDFQMEDEDNFEQKKGATAFDIVVPATLDNSEAMNTFFNPMSEDLSPDNFLKDVQPFSMVAGGNEFMVGKAILKRARKTNVPKDMEVDLYARNGDWAIENSELTLHDVVTDQTHIFDLSTATVPGVIDTSWNYDGSTEGEEFVYAPARYRNTFSESDTDIPLAGLKPAFFKYWLLYRGFKMAGYKVVSNFLDSEYFRRQVMPWTWGSFLYIDSPELDVLKFKAKLRTGICHFNISTNGTFTHPMDSGDNFYIDNETTDGAFDNAGTYDYLSGTFMRFTYLPSLHAQFGDLQFIMRFYSQMSYTVTYGSDLTIDILWALNGTLVQLTNLLTVSAGPIGSMINVDAVLQTTYLSPPMTSGDVLTARIVIGSNVGVTALASEIDVNFSVGSLYGETYLEMIGFKTPVGGIVDFKKHIGLKNYKWLDLFRGVIDEFNLQFQTDSIGKVVYIEPTHQYSLDSNPIASNPGYYSGALQDWTEKQDLNKITTIENYADYDQVFKIRYKNDENDGMYKLVSDRYKTNITEAMYQFPTRFKKGTREMENRFFGGSMHYKHEAFKSITGISPQLMCLIPENISNSSNPSSESLMLPKSAYYKGLVDRDVYGGWSLDGVDTYDLPFMFAVNYFQGGEDDPILTYCDQKIDPDGTPVKGMGLFKRFFWQRFAIMRHGKRMISSMALNNSDAMDFLQREYKIIGEGKYQLVAINGYRPLINDSTECTFWLWWPVSQEDYNNTFPSDNSVMHGIPDINTIDPKYTPLICLHSDIPT